MKKLLLCLFSSFLFLVTYPQQPAISGQHVPHPIKSSSPATLKPHERIFKTAGVSTDFAMQNQNPVKIKNTSVHRSQAQRISSQNIRIAATEDVIGSTTYDLQTNGTISNRITNNGDGTFSAVWTMSQDPDPTGGWPDRGTGYNYYDGFSWDAQPSVSIEPNRSGFTNVAYVPGGHEATLAHDAAVGAAGSPFTSRATKGTGSWATTVVSGTSETSLWPKMTAGGANGQSFHAIMDGTNATGPLWYTRSTDNGATWSTPGEIPQYVQGTDYFGIGGDSYSIDARGDVVAIAVGDLDQDLVLLKSIDNGATWTKTIVESFPVPLFDSNTMNTDTDNDGTADTLWTNSSDAAVVIDNNNMAHVVFGRTRIFEDAGGTNISGFSTTGLYYWNESMGADNYALLSWTPDLNGDGVISLPVGCGNDPTNDAIGYYGTGFRQYIGMPSLGIDGNNNIYCVYQAIDELSDTSIFNEAFVHPYIIKSSNGGLFWTEPDNALDVVLATQGVQAEVYDGAFAALTRTVDANAHILYQRDFAPGTTLSGATTPTCESQNNNGSFNDMVYTQLDIADIPAGNRVLSTHNIQIPTVFGLINYPNPFHGTTTLEFTLNKSSDVKIEVSDLLGRIAYENIFTKMHSGNNKVTIDASAFVPGIFICKVVAGTDIIIKKLIVE